MHNFGAGQATIPGRAASTGYHSHSFHFSHEILSLHPPCPGPDDAQPRQLQKRLARHATALTATQQITTGSWRLDQITERGQVIGTGAGIKDQYSLTFRPDGTYTQKVLAANTTYSGTWMLMNNNTTLHLTDSKGESTEYIVVKLSATELRYSFINKDGFMEERLFSAQP
jgi:hypothetical protein